METFSALLAICVVNSPVPGEFPTQRPVTRIFDVFFDLHPNKRLSNIYIYITLYGGDIGNRVNANYERITSRVVV